MLPPKMLEKAPRMPWPMVWARTTIPRTTPRYSAIWKPSRLLAVVTMTWVSSMGASRMTNGEGSLRCRGPPAPDLFGHRLFVIGRWSFGCPPQHWLLGRLHLVGAADAQRVRRVVQELGVLLANEQQHIGKGV